jgi:hypothetical protein
MYEIENNFDNSIETDISNIEDTRDIAKVVAEVNNNFVQINKLSNQQIKGRKIQELKDIVRKIQEKYVNLIRSTDDISVFEMLVISYSESVEKKLDSSLYDSVLLKNTIE